jgi:hypothetical protein
MHHQNINPVKIESTTLAKKSKGKGQLFLKKIFSKKYSKFTTDKINRSGLIAFSVGLFSFALLTAGFVLLSSSGTVLIFLLAGITALLGDILSIRTLMKIRNSESDEDYMLSKSLSILGLVFSLSTGLIPLGLLLLVIFSI